MYVAVSCRGDAVALLRAPYHQTVWAYCHLLQRDRLEDLRDRGRELRTAGLMTLAFHEPKKLNEEHQRLLAAAGLLGAPESPDDARARALALVADVARVDSAGAWGKKVQ